jgi:hypothetical protein
MIKTTKKSALSIQLLWESVRICGAAAATLLFTTYAHASPVNLVTNGSFESTSGATPSFFFGPSDQSGILTGWSVNLTNAASVDGTYSNEIVYAPGSPVATRFDGIQFALWGTVPVSPDGGNYVTMVSDTNYDLPLQQTITGLTPGDSYTATFDWAAAEYECVGTTCATMGFQANGLAPRATHGR